MHFTALESDDNINPLELNLRFQELSSAIAAILAGGLPQTPTITDFTNAVHHHRNPAGGGQLTVAAIDSESSDEGQVAASDGAGGVAWTDPIDSFLELVDTFGNYTGRGGEVLRVNALATGIESVSLPIEDYVLNEGSDYSTTSTTKVPVDATKLSLELTTTGDVGVIVAFSAVVYNATNFAVINFDLEVDGNILAGDDGVILTQFVTGGGRAVLGFFRYIRLPEGDHEITLLWSTSAGTAFLYAGAGTTNANVHPQLVVMGVM